MLTRAKLRARHALAPRERRPIRRRAADGAGRSYCTTALTSAFRGWCARERGARKEAGRTGGGGPADQLSSIARDGSGLRRRPEGRRRQVLAETAVRGVRWHTVASRRLFNVRLMRRRDGESSVSERGCRRQRELQDCPDDRERTRAATDPTHALRIPAEPPSSNPSLSPGVWTCRPHG
jgi:hypothetical protein